MRLVTYRAGGAVRVGALQGDAIVDVGHDDMLELLAGGDAAMDAARAAADSAGGGTPLADVELLPPVPRPPKIICVARNYGAHAKEAGLEPTEYPNLFARFAQTLVGQGAPIVRPNVSDELDWEGELAFVIGTGGRHVAKADAYDHVAGYSIFNDVSVRDYQFKVPQFVAGKNFEATGPFGPALVTRDEVPDPHALQLETRVNDDVVQSTSTGDMLFDIPTLIATISEFITLEPGDVVATGTPSGVGFVRKPPWFLVPGDVCTVSITGLGELANPVVQES